MLTTQQMIARAAQSLTTFEVDLRRPLARAYIGKRFVGLLDPDTLDAIRWPIVPEADPMAVMVRRLHAIADKSRKFGRCYFIGGDEGLVKIGYSSDIPGRLAAIQSCSPVRLRVLAIASGGPDREAAYHAQFAEFRAHGEWFERCPEIEAEIARHHG